MTFDANEMVCAAADRDASAFLRGFWNERNNTLGAVPTHLRTGVAKRAQDRLARCSAERRLVVLDWPLWVHQAAAL